VSVPSLVALPMRGCGTRWTGHQTRHEVNKLECISLEHFGASAPYQIIYEQFGITPERIVAAAHSSLSKVGATQGSTTGN
jgi:pyruvate dehydrogenase complex dehydrogenase (E1) component